MDSFVSTYVWPAAIMIGQSLLLLVALLLFIAYILLADRKIWAAVQMRRGPNVVGPWGLFQSFADLLKFVFKEPVIPAGANVILNLILVPRFGLMGAAWATAASFGLGLIATMMIGRKVVALPIPWESLIRCSVATAIMALVVSRLPPLGGFPELMLDASVGGIVYAAAALTLNAAGVRDVAKRLLTQFRARGAAA